MSLPYRLMQVLGRSLLSACALLVLPVAAQLPIVLGEPAVGAKAVSAPEIRLQGLIEQQPALRATARLPAVTDAELSGLQRINSTAALRSQAKRVAIGLQRAAELTPALPGAASLTWISVDGGYAAQMAVTSPDAAALRVALDLSAAPAGLQMVFYGSGDPAHRVGPIAVGDLPDRTSAWWSPVTEGETQVVELFAPTGLDPRSLALRATAVSHLFSGPASGFEKRVQDIGRSASCNVDLPCSNLYPDAAFQNAAAAVAQMVFNDTDYVYLCSGTLLTDTDASTQIPWFFSANHCFDNETPPYKTAGEMQVIANTLETLWLFQSSTCNSHIPSSGYAELDTGATYITSNGTSDILFLRLNGSPPAGAFFAGWNANALAANAAVVAIHHPQGDLKKVSQGTVLGFGTPTNAPASSGTNQYVQVHWNSGTMEAGSSGGGLFTNISAQYVLRGALWGGPLATCETGPELFSRFDLAYAALAPYLSPSVSPAFDYTDLWWGGASETGWGLNLVQHPSHTIFGAWYTYGPDRKPVWYVMPSGSWSTSTTYIGPLYTTSGPAYNGPFDPSRVVITQVGTGTLHFTDANNGTWSYTVSGTAGTKNIQRQPY